MIVEDGTTLWFVVGEDILGRKRRGMDSHPYELTIEQVIDYAKQLMKSKAIKKAKVYIFRKIGEREVSLDG